ncbi:hypothetical protein DH2020_005985 [Rehmannia glutinosa]|uniref:Protein KAKU4 n=1 Tax=Rehmannia glutinosa TaxID=99300 RepID=A0ABR0XI85_REHGL
MATSRSGAGGKIVTNRRKQRLSATPYDRPPPQPAPPPPPKSPNWFTGIVVPSARFLASGAGKILYSIFSESESSSEDEDSASEDDIDDDNHFEIPYNGDNMLNETNVTSSEIMHHGQKSQLSVWRSETKRTIEQLIMQESFSREECDKLIKVLNSRVTVSREKNMLAGSPGKAVDNGTEDVDIYNKAVQEAKKWFQQKKVGSSSVTELAHGTCNLNSTGLGHVETGGSSPVDVARSYMKDRPPWASPTRNVELRTPSTTTMKLFKEGTLYSVGQDSLSSSKKRNSLVSGSWNIQEELRRVRSKATEDMLRTPSAKIDSSLFAVAPIRVESIGAGEEVLGMGERMTETVSLRETKPVDALVDAGVSSDPALTFFLKDPETVPADGECAASEFAHPSRSDHAEEHHTAVNLVQDPSVSIIRLCLSGWINSIAVYGPSTYWLPDIRRWDESDKENKDAGRGAKLKQEHPCLSIINGVPATEVTENGGKQIVNGLSSSQASLSAGVVAGLNKEQHDEENQNADTVKEKKPANIINVEGNCELLSEAYMEVPVVTETDSIASGSQNSMGMQYDELSLDMAQPSPDEKVNIVAGKQQGRKTAKPKRQRKSAISDMICVLLAFEHGSGLEC